MTEVALEPTTFTYAFKFQEVLRLNPTRIFLLSQIFSIDSPKLATSQVWLFKTNNINVNLEKENWLEVVWNLAK